MGFLDRLLGRKRILEGKRASTWGDRLSLYESGLRALLEAGDGFIVFEDKDKDGRFVQFAADSSSAGLTGEVGSQAVPDEADEMLHDLGFRLSDDTAGPESPPNYSRVFEEPDARALAELVEKIFIDTLGCPDTYTAEVVASESH